MPLTIGDLEKGFDTYFREMEKCEGAECYWALLHLVVVMPDICAALQHPKGDTTGETAECYQDWCRRYWHSTAVPPKRRWNIRCALLHQGRTVLKGGETFSYIRPAPLGSKVHEYVHPGEKNTTLEVDKLHAEVKAAVRAWFAHLTTPLSGKELANVAKHLPWLAKDKPKSFGPDVVIQGQIANSRTTSST